MTCGRLPSLIVLAVASSVLILSDCKVDVETKVNTDDLTAVEHKLVKGDIDFEFIRDLVARCIATIIAARR
ncbi:hypothetical protein [Xenorhabdus siamensis]|uniref:hypothetical protein n=1 Tax=Xenorhabdus siamensis TaxID=3136254 RepID=UPI0030F490D7